MSEASEAASVASTIIIPTYNRKDSLRELLESLSHQSCPGESYEVVVVDDGSTDGTEEMAGYPYPFFLRYIRQPNQGSAVARNTGAQAARGKLLIFLDDDMWVDEEYVQGLIEEHQRFPRIISMGRLLPNPIENPSPFARTYIFESIKWGVSGEDGKEVAFTACVTNNISVERDDFFEIGMMQDVAGDGPTWWGDIDFGYRAFLKGFHFRISGKAACIHRDYSFRDLETAQKRAYKSGLLAVPLFQKHIDLIRYIRMFRDNTSISLKADPPLLILRKIARIFASTRPALWILRTFTKKLEQQRPDSNFLPSLYIWILGGYQFRGFRDGIRKYGPLVERALER